MSKTWLLIDVSNLAHRAWHTTGNMAYNGQGTGLLFGVLRDVLRLSLEYPDAGFAFCFDSYFSLRQDNYPEYKSNRVGGPDEAFIEQISLLREYVLEKLGFQNLFIATGYEADDVIASAVGSLPAEDSAVIISSDRDLFQCLRPNVNMYSPATKRMYTLEWFEKEYSLIADYWSSVKAIAGCDGDKVEGVPGVGEKTAVKFLRCLLKHSTKAYRSIVSDEGQERIDRNFSLVRLPYKDCPLFFFRPDQVTNEKWRKVLTEYGMASLQKYLKGAALVGRKH